LRERLGGRSHDRLHQILLLGLRDQSRGDVTLDDANHRPLLVVNRQLIGVGPRGDDLAAPRRGPQRFGSEERHPRQALPQP
jgi:hypothetical protein